jgi:PAS domain S-box-containing protein
MAYQCRYDSNHTVEYASKGCFNLTGYPPEDLILNQVVSYAELIHSEDREKVWKDIQTAIKKRKSFELVYRIQTRNGKEKWVRELGVDVSGNNGNLHHLEGFITDITEWKLAERQIQRQIRRFQALRAIDTAISAGPDLKFTLEILLEQIMSQLNVDAADILLFKPGKSSLEYGESRGFQTDALKFTYLQMGEGFAGKAAQLRKTIHIPDLRAKPGTLKQSTLLTDEGFRVYYGVPLLAKGQVKGVLEVFQRTPKTVDGEWLDFLEALAGQAAIAIDNATLFEQLQRTNIELSVAYDATLEGWAKALELRDRETVGHAHRVIQMTLRIAEQIGIRGDATQHLCRGALLHDIGKMGIPDSILLKPGPLTPNEWEIMRQHPIYAYEMLRTIDYLGPALEIPYCHHEKWDGTGYPRGLKAKEIPISARIFAVVDVWDALTSDRPYRFAWPKNKASEYIQMESGKHFDPMMVKAFFRQ